MLSPRGCVKRLGAFLFSGGFFFEIGDPILDVRAQPTDRAPCELDALWETLFRHRAIKRGGRKSRHRYDVSPAKDFGLDRCDAHACSNS